MLSIECDIPSDQDFDQIMYATCGHFFYSGAWMRNSLAANHAPDLSKVVLYGPVEGWYCHEGSGW